MPINRAAQKAKRPGKRQINAERRRASKSLAHSQEQVHTSSSTHPKALEETQLPSQTLAQDNAPEKKTGAKHTQNCVELLELEQSFQVQNATEIVIEKASARWCDMLDEEMDFTVVPVFEPSFHYKLASEARFVKLLDNLRKKLVNTAPGLSKNVLKDMDEVQCIIERIRTRRLKFTSAQTTHKEHNLKIQESLLQSAETQIGLNKKVASVVHQESVQEQTASVAPRMQPSLQKSCTRNQVVSQTFAKSFVEAKEETNLLEPLVSLEEKVANINGKQVEYFVFCPNYSKTKTSLLRMTVVDSSPDPSNTGAREVNRWGLLIPDSKVYAEPQRHCNAQDLKAIKNAEQFNLRKWDSGIEIKL